jgi:hypothetical protein
MLEVSFIGSLITCIQPITNWITGNGARLILERWFTIDGVSLNERDGLGIWDTNFEITSTVMVLKFYWWKYPCNLNYKQSINFKINSPWLQPNVSNWTHSEIGFKVKHMMFTTFLGNFNFWCYFIENRKRCLLNAKIHFMWAVASVNTSNADREAFASADFDAEYSRNCFQATLHKAVWLRNWDLTCLMA